MEYVQERIPTLHAFEGAVPDVPLDDVGIIVPLSGRDCGSLAAEQVFDALEGLDPAAVIVPVHAAPERIGRLTAWIEAFSLPSTVLWCNAPSVGAVLAEAGLPAEGGKGRDVWLGFGLAIEEADISSLVIHDADARTFSTDVVRRLVWPLTAGFEATKGYYARVENGRLYGRLFRLFYRPLVRAIADRHPAPITRYLEAFRYALAGEMALPVTTARRCRPHPGWGFEVGMLGEYYDLVGPSSIAQVDLGIHEHEHRSVSGPSGLSSMAEAVGAALFRVLEGHEVSVAHPSLREAYRETAVTMLRGYEADARFNGLTYDRSAERAQVDAYAEAIGPPGADPRLPSWASTSLAAERVQTASAAALEGLDE